MQAAAVVTTQQHYEWIRGKDKIWMKLRAIWPGTAIDNVIKMMKRRAHFVLIMAIYCYWEWGWWTLYISFNFHHCMILQYLHIDITLILAGNKNPSCCFLYIRFVHLIHECNSVTRNCIGKQAKFYITSQTPLLISTATVYTVFWYPLLCCYLFHTAVSLSHSLFLSNILPFLNSMHLFSFLHSPSSFTHTPSSSVTHHTFHPQLHPPFPSHMNFVFLTHMFLCRFCNGKREH